MMDDGRPPELPTHCRLMFAVIVVVEANVAVVFTGSRLQHAAALDPRRGTISVSRRLLQERGRAAQRIGVAVRHGLFAGDLRARDLLRYVEGFGLRSDADGSTPSEA